MEWLNSPVAGNASSGDTRAARLSLACAWLWPMAVVLLVVWNVSTALHLEDLGVAFRLAPLLALPGVIPAVVAFRRCHGASKALALAAVILNSAMAAFGLLALLR